MSDFDKWFDDNGYDEQHRSMFETVWNSAVDQLTQTNKEQEEEIQTLQNYSQELSEQVKELEEKLNSANMLFEEANSKHGALFEEVKALKADKSALLEISKEMLRNHSMDMMICDQSEYVTVIEKAEAIEQGEQ